MFLQVKVLVLFFFVKQKQKQKKQYFDDTFLGEWSVIPKVK